MEEETLLGNILTLENECPLPESNIASRKIINTEIHSDPHDRLYKFTPLLKKTPLKQEERLKSLIIRNISFVNSKTVPGNSLTKLLVPAVFCDSCLEEKLFPIDVSERATCVACTSHLPMVGASIVFRGGKERPSPSVAIKKSSTLWRDAFSAAFSKSRKFYGVWSTVLVVWVLTLVLICDFQSYTSSKSNPSVAITTVLAAPRQSHQHPGHKVKQQESFPVNNEGRSSNVNDPLNLKPVYVDADARSIVAKTIALAPYFVWNILSMIGVYKKVLGEY